jgi:hypothetical protein
MRLHSVISPFARSLNTSEGSLKDDVPLVVNHVLRLHTVHGTLHLQLVQGHKVPALHKEPQALAGKERDRVVQPRCGPDGGREEESAGRGRRVAAGLARHVCGYGASGRRDAAIA